MEPSISNQGDPCQFSYENEYASLSVESKKDVDWDKWRLTSQMLEEMLVMGSEPDMIRYAERIQACAKSLLFALDADSEGEVKHRLKSAYFCRFRHCAVCQARRVRRNYAKFLNSLPSFLSEYPGGRWIFLTLTVPNVDIMVLRKTIISMNAAWNRFTKRKEFKNVLGWVRSTEITKDSKRFNYAHPHFHVLMFVKSTYFCRDNYVDREDWLKAWRGSMRDESIVSVDVRIADKSRGSRLSGYELVKSVSEALKYAVKPSDMLQDRAWVVELIRQVYNLRFLASGGLFKSIFAEKLTNQEMINAGEQKPGNEVTEWVYWWKPFVKKYLRKRNPSN